MKEPKEQKEPNRSSIQSFQRYKQLNARVLKTDGEAVLKSMVENVNRMLKQKMDAVMVSFIFIVTGIPCI